MFFKAVAVLIFLTRADLPLASNEARQRVKRADDGGPLEAVVQQLSQQVTSLTAKVAALETKTNILDQTVAFYAWHDIHPLKTLPLGNLMFNHAATNVGDAYDTSNGVFTAPVAGLYDFQLTIMGYNRTGVVRAGIYVDGSRQVISISDNRNGTNYQQATARTIVHLNVGSAVMARNTDNSVVDFYATPWAHYSSFSGFLIKADG